MPDTSSLNKEQLQAVTHGQGALLIIAGAGTGKTTVITKRIENLILEEKVSPSNILALTFTEKAAQEMESRIDEIMPYGYTDMWIATFHAFCDRILRQEAIHIGLNPRYDLMTEAEALLFLKKNIFEFELDYFRPLGNPMKFLQGMLQHFSRLKDDDITTDQYLNYAKKLSHPVIARSNSDEAISSKKNKTKEIATLPSVARNDNNADPEEIKKTMELAQAFKKYEELKTKAGVMDFSDLISNTLKLFRTRKNVLKRYQDLFKFILVDEFQDTNFAQNEMAILLAGDKQNITVVGDDDQSIYRWRGTAIANMLQFRSHFPKAKIITLNKNYRSTQNILDSAYKMIQNNNPDRLEIKEKIDKKLSAMREIKGEEIEFIYTNKVEDEAESVAKKIRDEVKRTNRPYNEFAILVRANDHATPFQRALDRLKIPFQFLGPGHLFQQEEIKDLIAYLHTLANFEDTSSLYRVLTIETFGIEARDVAAILNFSKKNNISLFEAMEKVAETTLTENGKERVTKIVEMMKKHLEQIPRETAGQILYNFFEDSGLLGYYLDPRSARTEKEAQNVAKFFTRIQSFTTNAVDASVFAVVDWLDMSMELGESPMSAEIDWTQNNAVNILTIHSSKGLEFPFVFVTNLVTQRFPSRDRKEQIPVPQDIIREELPTGDENIQEERRLFYVAVTRAKDKLFLTASKFYGEGKRERKLSPFVIETLNEKELAQILKKQTIAPQVQQLSLLEMFNANIEEQESKKPKEETPSIYNPTYISYSQLQTFQTCPLHYKLRYIMNVPTAPAPALSYGISVHSTLRDFTQQIKNGEKITAEDIKNLLKTNWMNQGYQGKTHEAQAYQQAEKMLIGVAQQTLTEKPNTIAIELPFNFWLNKKQGSLKVGGRIDRVDKLPDGRIEIIDYKTGHNVPTEKKVKEDFQLSFYALAANLVKDAIFNVTPDEIVLTLYYLEANQKLSTTRSKKDLEDAKEKILSMVDEIENSGFRCAGGMFCKNCEYAMLCQSFS
ncbi:ATP-dependent helicase [Candidatus Roizmanbacteria bacterium]|nr:ATP-dependent helicase [Candidatus Roizmanbacteria bacterium]